MTAGHCVEYKGKLKKDKLKFLDAKNVDLHTEVLPVGYDETTDFGLLKGDFDKYFILKSDFVNSGFISGKVMVACGFPFGQKGLTCNPIRVVNNDFLAVRVEGFLRNGMSGGPVIDPNTGIAYGINFAIVDGFSYVNSLQGFLGFFGID